MRIFLTLLTMAAALAASATAWAAANPSGSGQPSQTCLSQTAPTE